MKNHKNSKTLIDAYIKWPFLLAPIPIFLFIIVWIIPENAFIPALALTLIYVAMAFGLYFMSRKQLISAFFSFSISENEMQEKFMRDMPISYCLLDFEGTIIWHNNFFQDITGKDMVNANIVNVFPNITEEMLGNEEAMIELHSTYNERKYRLDFLSAKLSDFINDENLDKPLLDPGKKITAVYINDETEEINLRNSLKNEHMVCGLIYIDNYEEVLNDIEEVRRSLLTALVDRKIKRYISSVNGLCKRIEKDKYFFILKYEYVDRILKDRFSILDEVRQVNIGNEMAVTLSIGMGYSGKSYQDNYEYSRNSIDMALGRGGDQAVVKTGSDFIYYGGKTQTLEKTTRVKARVKAQAFQEIIENKDRVIIMGHAMSDVDCFGSSIGIYRIAETLGKKAYIVQNEITASVATLKESFLTNSNYPDDMFVSGEKASTMIDDSTVLVVVDCNRPSIVDYPRLLKLCRTKVVFDHHRQSSENIENAVLSYCEPYASSACEMITEILQYIGDGIRIKSIEADAMYAGIVIDSQEFTNQTGVRTFEAAAYLRRCGADITRVRKLFREDMKDYKAKADAIRNVDIYKDSYAFSYVDSKGLESPTVICAQAANGLLDVAGVKASIVMTEYNDIIFISARSIDEMNVQVLMEKLGGGGHRSIAGAQLKEGTIEDAVNMVKKAIDEMIEEGETS